MTTLKEFVENTLSEVTEALVAFENKQQEKRLGITPFPKLSEKVISPQGAAGYAVALHKADDGTRYYHVVMPMEFDVAVTASSESGDKIGGGLRVLEFFSASGETTSTAANSTVSRIKFRVPLQLARSDTSK